MRSKEALLKNFFANVDVVLRTQKVAATSQRWEVSWQLLLEIVCVRVERQWTTSSTASAGKRVGSGVLGCWHAEGRHAAMGQVVCASKQALREPKAAACLVRDLLNPWVPVHTWMPLLALPAGRGAADAAGAGRGTAAGARGPVRQHQHAGVVAAVVAGAVCAPM